MEVSYNHIPIHQMKCEENISKLLISYQQLANTWFKRSGILS